MKNLFGILLLLPSFLLGQVGIGTNNPDLSAVLDVASTSKGLLLPRVSSANLPINPTNGLILYQTDGTNGLWHRTGNNWGYIPVWHINTGMPASWISPNKPAGIQSAAQGNLGFGLSAMNGLTTGDYNTGFGHNVLTSMSTGTYNTGIGYNGGSAISTGTYNTTLGYIAGNSITTGDGNTLIGANAQVSSGSLTNATALGISAQATASNMIQLGNSSVTKVNTSGTITTTGNLGVGTTSVNASAALEISSTSKGVLFPRLSSSQRDAISSPATGLVIFNSTFNKLQVYTGAPINGAASSEFCGGVHFYRDGIYYNNIGQSFIAASSNTLKSITIKVSEFSSPGYVTIKLYSGSGIGGSIIATTGGSITTAGDLTFNFPTEPNLVSGSTYTFLLVASNGLDIYAGTCDSNVYTSGGYYYNADNASGFLPDFDLYFTVNLGPLGWVNVN